MMTKKTAFGMTGAAAAALLTVGAVAPAMADDSTSSSTTDATSTISRVLGDVGLHTGDASNESPVVVAPSVDAGDIASGNAVGSGNDADAPVLSGNSADIGTNVSDVVDSTVGDLVDNTVGDVSSDVSDVVDDVTGGLDLDNVLGD